MPKVVFEYYRHEWGNLANIWKQGVQIFKAFKDFCMSKAWYKVHTTNKINPIYLQILPFKASNCFV